MTGIERHQEIAARPRIERRQTNGPAEDEEKQHGRCNHHVPASAREAREDALALASPASAVHWFVHCDMCGPCGAVPLSHTSLCWINWGRLWNELRAITLVGVREGIHAYDTNNVFAKILRGSCQPTKSMRTLKPDFMAACRGARAHTRHPQAPGAMSGCSPVHLADA